MALPIEAPDGVAGILCVRARGLIEAEANCEAITAHVNRTSESIRFVDDLKATIDDIRSQLTLRMVAESVLQSSTAHPTA